MAIKWVIVEKVGYSGREAAVRGLSFLTKEEAEACRLTWNEYRQKRTHIESRQIMADDKADRMTCQCCGRLILANTGRIAHHGYTRPGSGWQTSSCMGAKFQPFEADRNRLGQMIDVMKARRERAIENRKDTASEAVGILVSWKKRSSFTKGYVPGSFEFTRANFASEEAQIARRAAPVYAFDYDELLKRELGAMDYRIRAIESHIAEEEKRYAGWKQTHKRLGVTWVRI